ncbi:hypothetical protein H0H87_004138 [Tephrocybe sp. NHM501043]|nr:hypothetical protein H0H87_004138 [Tephrocybe sp. NHM501043]
MPLRSYFTSLLGLFVAFQGVSASGSAMQGMDDAILIQQEQIQRMHDFLGPISNAKEPEPPASITFKNPAAKKFFVEGTKIPEGKSNHLSPHQLAARVAHRSKVFYKKMVLFVGSVDLGVIFLYLTIFKAWSWGQAKPTANPWSWTNLSHVLWVEQPVGTGFSQGAPNITNDDELAAQLTGFLGQFLEVFSELKGNNLYLTGESYAGFYVPYIANWIYEHPGLELSLKGIWIADPSLSYGVVQQEIPALRFAQANKNLFAFNSTFWETLQTISDECGYTDYLDKFVTYPPKGQLPFPVATNGTFSVTPACRMHSPIQRAIGLTSFLSPKGLASQSSKQSGLRITTGLGQCMYLPRNMTWGGAQGFQTPIESENFLVKDMGVYGNMHTERGLTCE